ncbi:MAG: tRNA pseudouridine(38-40) synthase TruA [Gammaproteobacteria bacterium]
MDKEKSRIALAVEYQGSRYKGFQKQKNTKETVQGFLENALSKVADQDVEIVCSGRTDAGVHAYNQIIHFDTSSLRDMKSWVKGGNALLPKDIRVLWAKEVPDSFHARFSAISRTYRYIIRNSLLPSALERDRALWVQEDLDLKAIRRASLHLKGEQDFTSFRSSSCQSKTPYRNIHLIRVFKKKELVAIEITANAFLLNMVRIIVGTLLEVGRRKIPAKQIKTILDQRDRNMAGKTSPAEGLYFIGAKYKRKFKLPSLLNSDI